MIGLKFFKWLFLTLSVFFVCACFIRKINNKPPLTMNYVLKRFESANIEFDFANHVQQYKLELNDYRIEEGDGIEIIGKIALNIASTCKLIFMLFVDTIKVGISIIEVVVDILGFELNVSSGTAMADNAFGSHTLP